jgi:hypothetical protein
MAGPPPSAGARRDDDTTSKSAVTVSRVAAVAVVLGIALLWIYAFTRQPQTPPDLLDEAETAQQAEQICAGAIAAIDELPLAFETRTPDARAAVIGRANDELRAMLTALRTLPVEGERDARMVDEWLDDWETFLADRDEYAQRLPGDPGARFYVTEKEGRQVTVPIDRFATVNRMPSCATPEDVG